MSKHRATPHPFGRGAVAHQLSEGAIVICDPDAPIEFGCRVLVAFSDCAVHGRCLTKHPSKAKSGINASYKDIFGNTDTLRGCAISGPERCVYRIVAEFPPVIPVARYHRRIVTDVYQPALEEAA